MLSDSQIKIAEYVRLSLAATGVAPTVREIQTACHFKSPRAASYHLSRLEQAGVIRRVHNKARSISLVDVPRLDVIPFRGSIPAGAPDTQTSEGHCIRIDLESIGLPKNIRTFALKVSGDSMIGAGILDKDIVLLEFKSPHEGAVVAALVDGETTLKRYVMRNGIPYLKAENPKYKDVIPARELVIQGVMVALVRKT